MSCFLFGEYVSTSLQCIEVWYKTATLFDPMAYALAFNLSFVEGLTVAKDNWPSNGHIHVPIH